MLSQILPDFNIFCTAVTRDDLIWRICSTICCSCTREPGCSNIMLKPTTSLEGSGRPAQRGGGQSECANFLICSRLSILLSFRDMTTRRTTDRRRTERRWQPSHIWPLKRASNKKLKRQQIVIKMSRSETTVCFKKKPDRYD